MIGDATETYVSYSYSVHCSGKAGKVEGVCIFLSCTAINRQKSTTKPSSRGLLFLGCKLSDQTAS